MSKLICTSAIDGAVEFVAQAVKKLDEAVKQKGLDCPVGFPDTNYFLPIIYSFTGKKMKTLADLRDILEEAKSLLPARPAENVWLPYLGSALDAGAAALFACEVIEACKYLIGPNPVDGIWLGAANDVIMRERGIEFVDGTAPGFAAITGAAPDNATAVKIAKELQQKNLYVFMGGCTNGVQFAEQLAAEGVQLGWETRLVPFGRDVSALIYALGFANRAALSFGGVKPGDYEANLKYNKNRIFAFVMALGEVTNDKYAAAAGAINYGFPVISDTDIPEILPTGVCTYEHVVSKVPHDKIVEKALEVRGCKIKIVNVPIPVAYGPAFEGERIRKEDTHVEFGGNKTLAFEFVTSVEYDAINDGEIKIIGPDIDTVEPGGRLPLGIWVEAAGRKMQPDFEPILERQIHHMINGAEGIWHMGQRDIVWTRVSKTGFERGIRLKHYGEILHAKLLADYPAIVDKVRVTLVTDQAEVEKRLAIARKVYDERNRRLEAMTDESVDTFYSCLLCQSFAPNHVCVITPERLGLCGAYNWLDGKAAYEIDETGPNQPLKKGECLDPVKGIWSGVSDYVFTNSHKTVETFCAYSIMDRPMTSCGCFEAICAYVPECNGVMVVNREYLGDTPIGMTFSTLAGSVGGGQQTPGFFGCGKVFLTSRKFLFAEGGYARIVWMTKELKDLLHNDLLRRFDEQKLPGFIDQIADETVAVTAEETRKFMEKVKHPALKMEDMSRFAQSEQTGETAAKTEAVKTENVKKDAPSGSTVSMSGP
ncbi:acetyl-CoA decarbonylase/synthase complex subunit alpha/beta, partial [Treponema sp. R8-4-B8]